MVSVTHLLKYLRLLLISESLSHESGSWFLYPWSGLRSSSHSPSGSNCDWPILLRRHSFRWCFSPTARLKTDGLLAGDPRGPLRASLDCVHQQASKPNLRFCVFLKTLTHHFKSFMTLAPNSFLKDTTSVISEELVNPGKFDDMRQAFPEEAFQSVLKSYCHHFDSGRLRSELQVLYSDQDLQSNKGKLCDYLVFLKDMELDSAMPQLYKLFSLVATIGATSAGVERSFSCLKRLKSYTRNTMGQGRLSSLALLAIERTLVKSLEKTPMFPAGYFQGPQTQRLVTHRLPPESCSCPDGCDRTPTLSSRVFSVPEV
ncbi:hypothetical protein E1301_Tti021025 [Triplophysa tibetana]|uniref:HAT C-terminal dimerisation domain-containing protein n=1 Tax=Triplophysa tibetana TaxID=1572043 RepID=A0A5A9NEU3_9TELE|nr:hypothetical protein E1301_Tti021025 [Triplophysa tibetana]